MADNLDSTIKSLDDLGRKSVSVSKLLEGSLANRLLDIANISEKTGRRWTIMSRLLSGSPLWKIQNKVRAVVDSLGMVREGVNKVAKEMSEADGSFIRYAKGYQAMEQQMMDASEAFNNTIYHGKIGWSKLNDDVQKAIKGTESYNKTLLATGSARKAQVASMTTLREKYKEAAKEHEKVKASVKEEYAFDKRRIEQAKKAAEYRAEVLKGGKRTIRKAGKKAAKQEKWQMKQDQKAVTKGAKKDSAKNTMKGLLNTSAFKPLLMPLKAFALPLVGMFKIAKNRKKYKDEGRCCCGVKLHKEADRGKLTCINCRQGFFRPFKRRGLKINFQEVFNATYNESCAK